MSRAPIDAPGMRFCGARCRDGSPCRQPAIRGSNRCRVHGGSIPQVRAAALQRVAEANVTRAVDRFAVPREVTAAEALRGELARTQGRVDLLEREVSERPNDPGLLAVYTAERGHLRQLADGMVRARVDERREALSDQLVEGLETALSAIVRDLGHDPDSEYIRQVIARRMREVAAGESTAQSTSSQNGELAVIDAEIVYDEPLAEPVAF